MSARKPSCRSRLDRVGTSPAVAVACYRSRNAGSTGSAWRLRDPEVGGSGVAVGVGSASEPACVFERAEGAVDLAGFLVAAERVAGLGAADPVVAVSCERPDVVSGWVTEAVAEDPGAACLCPKPLSTGNGPSAQLPLKVPPKQPQPATRPVLATCPDVASPKQQPRRQRSHCGTRTQPATTSWPDSRASPKASLDPRVGRTRTLPVRHQQGAPRSRARTARTEPGAADAAGGARFVTG